MSNGMIAGLDVSLNAGLESVIRVNVRRQGEPVELNWYTFQGVAYDEDMWRRMQEGEEVEGVSLDVSVALDDESAVEVGVPALAAGKWRYIISATAGGSDTIPFLRGMLGVFAPDVVLAAHSDRELEAVLDLPSTIAELPEGVGKCRAHWLVGTMAEAAAQRATGALETVEDKIAELDRVMPAVEALESGIENAVTINEYGNWQVGNIDKGVRAQGPAGQSGAEVQYHVIASEADLPTDAEHCSSLHRYLIRTSGTYARGESYMRPVSHDADDPPIELKIAGVSYEVTGELAALTWMGRLVAAINNDSNCPVTAEREYDPTGYILILTAKVAGAAGNWITVEATGSGGAGDFIIVPNPPMSGGSDATTYQYVWADGAWVKLPLDAGAIATQQSHGLVKLGTVGGSGNKVPVVEGSDGGIYVDMPSLPPLDRLAELEARMSAAESSAAALAARVAALEGAGYVSSSSVEHVEVVDELPPTPDAATLYIKTADEA